jgi:hypothetical protein
MKLKRDLTSTAAPATNQIEVGELAINAKTGVLYSKMTDGTVIKFVGTAVCDSEHNNSCPVPVPEISFSDVTNFCCGYTGSNTNIKFSPKSKIKLMCFFDGVS